MRWLRIWITSCFVGAYLLAALAAKAYANDTWASPVATELPFILKASCVAPLEWYGTDELNPSAIDREIDSGSWVWALVSYRLNLELAQGVGCNDQCRLRIIQSAANALNLWRHMCMTCAPGMLTVVAIDDQVLLDIRFYTALLRRKGNFAERFATAVNASFLNDELPELPDRDTIGHSYIQISAAHPIVTELCDAIWAEEHALLGAFQASICLGAGPTTTIRFSDTPPCGIENAIACGDPEKRIDFWTRYIGYFDMQSSGQPEFILGERGALPADRVDLLYLFAHEFGHVLGLKHIQEKNAPANLPAVMLSHLQEEFCLSIAEIMLISAVAASDYDWRAQTGLALYRRGYEPTP